MKLPFKKGWKRPTLTLLDAQALRQGVLKAKKQNEGNQLSMHQEAA